MIVLIDYGVGNLFSLTSSFHAIGQDVKVTGAAEDLKKADKIILPGVGAFRDAAALLRERELDTAVKAAALSGTPLLGICLGMQLLFDKSYEYGEYEGLGLIPGAVRPIRDVIPADLKVPHIGWNPLILKKESPILKYVHAGDCVYFVHSYYAANCETAVIATAEYGAELTAAVQKDLVFGCQFHPEKSGDVGLRMLQAFCEL